MNSPADSLPTSEALARRLQERLSPAFLEVIDESAAHAGHAGHAGAHASGRGTHFRVRLGGDRLARLSRVERHRLVYDALQDFLNQGLHALAIEIVPVLSESN